MAPAIVAVDGNLVEFEDGSRAQFDAIVCATGYALDLPYLAPGIRQALGADDTYLDLYQRTLHPDLPGLGFLGQYVLQGPYVPVLELQAGWLAGGWSGGVDAPTAERMRAGIEEYRAMKPMLGFDLHHVLASMLAAELGVAPDLSPVPSSPSSSSSARWWGRATGSTAPGRPARRKSSSAERCPSSGPEPVLRPPTSRSPALQGVAGALGDPALQGVAGALGDPALAEAAARLAQARAQEALAA